MLAYDDCFVPIADWQSRKAVERFAAKNGWKVHHIKIDDSCHEIKGTDVDGRRIEVIEQPGTLQAIEIEYEDDHDDHRRRTPKRKIDD